MAKYVKYVRITHTEYKAYSKMPVLVAPDMVVISCVHFQLFKKVRFYFKTEIEANVLGR